MKIKLLLPIALLMNFFSDTWACNPPITFFSSATTASSTTLSWLPGIATSTQWQIEYGPAGFTLGQGIRTLVGPSPQTISNLSGSSTYHFYIREICGPNDTSAWLTPPILVTTLCSGTISTPWFENFDGPQWVPYINLLNKGSVANCWFLNPAYNQNGYQWFVNPNGLLNIFSGALNDHTTGTGKFLAAEHSGANTGAAIIRTPAIDLSGVTNPEIRFWYHMFGSAIGSLQVDVQQVGGSGWTNVQTITGQQQSSNTALWAQSIQSLSAFANQTVFIRFRATSLGATLNQAKISIDDISIVAGSNCAKPNGLVASNVYPNSLQLNWLAGAGINEVKYGASGFNPNTSGTSVLTPANNTPITGLTPASTYQFYVRRICGTDTSAWESPITVQTPCLINAPFLENFNAAPWVLPSLTQFLGQVNSCWLRTTSLPYSWVPGPDFINNNFTGPSGGNPNGTGKFMFTVTRQFSPSLPPQQADLETPFFNLNPLDTPELSFYYHMFGADIGSVQLQIFSDSVWTTLLTISGQQQNSKTAPWIESVVNLDNYVNKTVKFRFRAVRNANGSLAQIAIDDFDLHEKPDCPKPSNLTATAPTFNSVNLQWTTGGATHWRIRYKPVSASSFNFVSASANSTILNGLLTNTQYEVWVKDSCGLNSTSVWVGPVTFRTTCAPFSAPYAENFDGSTWVPWTNLNPTGSVDPCFQRSDSAFYYWTVGPPPFQNFQSGPSADHTSGSGRYVYTRLNNFISASNPTIFRTPWVDLSTVNGPQLKFWTHMYGNRIEKLEVRVLRYNGPSQLVLTINGQQQATKTAPWQLQTINLQNFANDTVRISFAAYFSSGGFTNATEIAIDDIEIGIPQTCFQATNFQVTASTSNSATFSWLSSGAAAGSFIEYGAVGFTPGTGSVVQATTNPFTVTGLTPGLNYHFYIRDSCNTGNLSIYTGPILVSTTPCPAVTAALNISTNALQASFDATASTGSVTAYSINFGDGNSTSDSIVTHTYTTSGTYTISLIVNNICGQFDTLIQTINVCETPLANFTANPTGLSLVFNNLSSGFNANYSWDFGDGNSSTTQSPTHSYATNGTYTITLIITDTCGGADTTAQTITVCAPLNAQISTTQSGLTVNFDGTNSGQANTYSWNFGDGNTSTSPNPSHTYASGGTYTVTLTVTNICGETSTTTITVSTCQTPQAAWSYQIISSGGSGMIVQFDGSSSIGASTFLWEFGDGNTNNTSATPLHTYTVPGLFYIVRLTVENACGDRNSLQGSLLSIGINENEYVAIEIYPNPVNDFIHIRSSSPAAIEQIIITDVQGRVVLSNKASQEDLTEINTTHLAQGLYFVTITGNSYTSIHKIVVQR